MTVVTSALGQTQRRRASGRSAHVGCPPIATEFCVAAKFRNVPSYDMRGDLYLISAPTNPLEELDRNSSAELLNLAPNMREALRGRYSIAR
jgi:hypothetical protein